MYGMVMLTWEMVNFRSSTKCTWISFDSSMVYVGPCVIPSNAKTREDLCILQQVLKSDGEFIDKGMFLYSVENSMVYTVTFFIILVLVALREAIAKNDEKLKAGNAMDKTLYALGWTIDELSRLNKECHLLYVDTTTLLEQLSDDATNIVTLNCARYLSSLQGRLQTFISLVSRHKRSAASHILVTMISPDSRNKKPYAVPVSFVPYIGLTEVKGRRLINKIVKEMNSRGMSVAGIIFMYTCTIMCVCLGGHWCVCILVHVHVCVDIGVYV